MKVLIVTQYFWPESFGITALARSMQERGVTVTVLTGQPNYPGGVVFPGYAAWRTSRETLSGIEIMRVPLAPRGIKSGLRLAVNYLSFVISASLLGPWMLRGRQFEAVFVYAPSPLLQALPAVLLSWWKRAPGTSSCAAARLYTPLETSCSPLTAVTAAGVFCRFSLRFCAVTMISPMPD